MSNIIEVVRNLSLTPEEHKAAYNAYRAAYNAAKFQTGTGLTFDERINAILFDDAQLKLAIESWEKASEEARSKREARSKATALAKKIIAGRATLEDADNKDVREATREVLAEYKRNLAVA